MAVFGRKEEEKLICHSRLDPDEIIHVDCVSHVYPDGSLGIHNLCFKVREREIVAVCGGNGSGKSTLLEHLNGLLNPTDGCVSVLGKKVDEKTKKYLWKDVGIVFQRAEDQLFAPTVLDDVMFGPLNMGLSVDDAKKVAMESLKAVGAQELVSKMPNYLSGGQKRLVSIAGVFAMKPKVIALDEPTSDLDPNHSEIIENIIFEMKNKYKISIVIATHDLDLAARIADRICIVKNGSIVAEGTPAEIFYNEALLEDTGLRKPKIVQIYEEYCRSQGRAEVHRPVTLPELAECFREG
ncbi:MAG: energy-coupling factor ABC transporter ATP-binding protein [Methanothrix sp.]